MLLEILEQEIRNFSIRKKPYTYQYTVLLDNHYISDLATLHKVLPDGCMAIDVISISPNKIDLRYFEQSNFIDNVRNMLSHYFSIETEKHSNLFPICGRQKSDKVVFSLEIPSLIEKQARINAKKQILEKDFN